MKDIRIPLHLTHKPIIGVDYKLIDETAGAGDAQFLSIGRSQWNPEDISAKVLRWTGEQWSRQSEELPLWRVLDLAILITANITGKRSCLNEFVVNDDDKEFLSSFLVENMELYQDKLLELKSLLNSLPPNPIKYNGPNIFSFATSELSQDAILAWIISWADDSFESENPNLCKLGKSLLEILTDIPSAEIHSVEVGRQWKNIDIWVEINDDSFLAIEDKTKTTIHDEQLNRYKGIVEEEYQGLRKNLYFAYVKIENEPLSRLNEIRRVCYKTISRTDLLKVLNSYNGNHPLIDDFRVHLQYIDNNTNSFKHYPIEKWNSLAWQGYFKELEKYLDIDSWGYVNNPAGGFMGMWWNWHDNDEVSMYLQFEQQKLCFKIYYDGSENKSEVRQKYHNRLIKLSDKVGLPVHRPERFGAGTYMTIGVVDDRYLFNNGYYNIKELYPKLKKLEELVKLAVM